MNMNLILQAIYAAFGVGAPRLRTSNRSQPKQTPDQRRDALEKAKTKRQAKAVKRGGPCRK